MKKTYKFLVLIIALFFGFVVKANATSYCGESTIPTFNSNSANTPASDQNIACGYESSIHGTGEGFGIEIYHTNNSYGDSYYIYEIIYTYGNAKYKMLMCTAENSDGQRYSYTETLPEYSSFKPYYSFANGFAYEIPYQEGDSEFNTDFIEYMQGQTSETYSTKQCPAYAGVVTHIDTEGLTYSSFGFIPVGYDIETGDRSIYSASGEGWSATYGRNNVTDNEHNSYNFVTDTETGAVTIQTNTDVTVIPASVKSGKITQNETIIENYEKNPCKTEGVLKTLRIVHTIIDIGKVAAPLIIIIVASVKFGKAAVNGDQDSLQSASKYFIKKLILSIVIFIVPTAINLIVDIVYETPRIEDKSTRFEYCAVCLSGDSKRCDRIIDQIDNGTLSDTEIIENFVEIDDPETRCSKAENNGLADYCREHTAGDQSGTAYLQCTGDSGNRTSFYRECLCHDNGYNGLAELAERSCAGSIGNTSAYVACLNSYVGPSTQLSSQYYNDCMDSFNN